MKIATITEMKQRNKIAGGHFFDRESMKFWGAKIHTAPNKYGFFLESHDSFDRSKKLYTIRVFLPSGHIGTELIEPADIANTYEHFPTLEAAKEFMKKVTAAMDNAAKCYRENTVFSDIIDIEEEGYNSGVYNVYNRAGEYVQINVNNFDRFICG